MTWFLKLRESSSTDVSFPKTVALSAWKSSQRYLLVLDIGSVSKTAWKTCDRFWGQLLPTEVKHPRSQATLKSSKIKLFCITKSPRSVRHYHYDVVSPIGKYDWRNLSPCVVVLHNDVYKYSIKETARFYYNDLLLSAKFTSIRIAGSQRQTPLLKVHLLWKLKPSSSVFSPAWYCWVKDHQATPCLYELKSQETCQMEMSAVKQTPPFSSWVIKGHEKTLSSKTHRLLRSEGNI